MISESIDKFQVNVEQEMDCDDPSSFVMRRDRTEKGHQGSYSRKRGTRLNQDVATWITQGGDPEALLDRMSKLGLLQGDGYGL